MKTKLARNSQGPARKAPRSLAPASEGTIDLVPALLKVKSILVPTDFSESSLKAIDYALSFARQFGAKLTLLYVAEPMPTHDFATFPLAMDDDKVKKAARQKLEALCVQPRIGPSLVEKILVRQGRAFHEISEAARALKVDLIIIATHGYTGVKHAFLGSTAERVVRHAPCPVLIVRQHERQFA